MCGGGGVDGGGEGGGGGNYCDLISHWRQRNQVRRDYYPTNGEEN